MRVNLLHAFINRRQPLTKRVFPCLGVLVLPLLLPLLLLREQRGLLSHQPATLRVRREHTLEDRHIVTSHLLLHVENLRGGGGGAPREDGFNLPPHLCFHTGCDFGIEVFEEGTTTTPHLSTALDSQPLSLSACQQFTGCEPHLNHSATSETRRTGHVSHLAVPGDPIDGVHRQVLQQSGLSGAVAPNQTCGDTKEKRGSHRWHHKHCTRCARISKSLYLNQKANL